VIKAKGYPTLVAQTTAPDIVFVTGEADQERTLQICEIVEWRFKNNAK
jgi:hypothetical protein